MSIEVSERKLNKYFMRDQYVFIGF